MRKDRRTGIIYDVDLAGLFAARSRSFTVGVALAFLVGTGYADWLTGRDISLSVFYVAPIALTTWFVNKRTGLLFAFLSTLMWFVADDMGRPHVQPLVPYWNAAVRLGFYVVALVILAKLKGALERERSLSREDATTGVANARAFLELASTEVERSHRFGRPITLLYVDCDDFKAVNDNHGHIIGDEVLRAAARTMQGDRRGRCRGSRAATARVAAGCNDRAGLAGDVQRGRSHISSGDGLGGGGAQGS
jgi:predicted signal transduction protein with EAL and GGDEF domain